MHALSSVVGAVAPALRSNAKALETALLTRVMFVEEGSVGCDARLAASQLLALLTQTAGYHFHLAKHYAQMQGSLEMID